jgi:hypothetical protein
MEILRFEEAPSGAPKRKKSSRSFLALGLVATLFGISTAFATTTININENTAISLGQGVNLITACDPKIGINPVTSLKDDLTTFQFEKIQLGSAYQGDTEYTIDRHHPVAETGLGCGGVDFKVKFYLKDTTPGASQEPISCKDLLGGTDTNGYLAGDLSGIFDITNSDSASLSGKFKCDDSAIFFRIPDALTTPTQTTFDLKFLANPSPDFFDHVTIETTSEDVRYTELTPYAS